MNEHWRRRSAALVVVGTAALLAATISEARRSADTIKLGSITILTGPSAQIGIETARGA